MKKVDSIIFRCGYIVGRLFIYYPKAIKNELFREKALHRKKI